MYFTGIHLNLQKYIVAAKLINFVRKIKVVVVLRLSVNQFAYNFILEDFYKSDECTDVNFNCRNVDRKMAV